MRKTYHFDEQLGKLVEGPGTRRVDGPSGDGFRFSDRMYSDNPFVAHDGTVINSRKKHREYMRRHGLTTVDDYSNTWKEKQKEREAFYTGQHDREGRRQDVARAIEALQKGR